VSERTKSESVLKNITAWRGVIQTKRGGNRGQQIPISNATKKQQEVEKRDIASEQTRTTSDENSPQIKSGYNDKRTSTFIASGKG